MNKNGFTLVELLAVIALMAIIIVLAVPATGAVKDKLNEHMLEKKIKLIENKSDLQNDYNSKIKCLLKLIVSANTLDKVDEAENAPNYKNFSCKAILRKISILCSLIPNKNGVSHRSTFQRNN